ncbi:Outer membrane protein OprM [Oligella urethralis]|uniref:efflux transporter outer membrane subunit n=1 Tax=Oligella urethralis TaxID=90245 RepID=UPI002958CCD9|nr:efflux transporter outer membrane subunit [Oligella urethralis]WOS38438.1 Outer membrane protein OprM [Oligella urethralis]
MRLKRLILALVALNAVSGCAVGPDYEVPAVVTASAFKGAPVNSAQWIDLKATQAWIRGDWWTLFKDAELNQLMLLLNQENQSIAQALARYQAAIAQRRSATADWFPNVGSTTSVTRAGGSEQDPNNRFSLGANLSWEADLWGSIRRSVESSTASEEEAEIALADARLSMQVQLLESYFQLRRTDLERELLRKIIQAYEQSLTITRNRYEQGVVAYADVVQAEAQLENARSDAIAVETNRRHYENMIAVLVGQMPSSFHIAERVDYLPEMISVPVGIPAELLRARPDVAAAERRVAAANAKIGVAQSAWLPRLSLSANGSYQATHFSDWIRSPLNVWSLGPQLVLSILDGGARQAAVDSAKAAYQSEVAAYRQAVLEAMREVENALTAAVNLEREQEAQQRALAASRQSLSIVMNQYQAGLVDYLSVAQVQNSTYNAEIRQLNLRASRLLNQVELIRALGGGWENPRLLQASR